MDHVNVLLTGCCSKGVTGIVKSLRQDPRIRIIGVDADTQTALPIFDAVHEISLGDSPTFIDDIKRVCEKEKISIILPQVTRELDSLSLERESFRANGVTVLISDSEALKTVNNKETLFKSVPTYIPTPNYFGGQLCAKPKIGNGGKGFRMLPDHQFLREDEVLMEYLPGKEYSADVLANDGDRLKVVVRRRDKVLDGLSIVGTVIDHEDIKYYCRQMVEIFKLHGIVGFQFKEDAKGKAKLIECNPRIQSGVELCTAAGYNMLTNAVRLALGEQILDTPVKYGTKMIRYYESIYV